MKRIKTYFITKWSETVKSMFPLRFKENEVHIVKVKKGKIREWRVFLNGERVSKDALKGTGINFNK